MYRQSWGDGRWNGFAKQNWPLFQWREAAASCKSGSKLTGVGRLFFVISADPPQLILIPPFINFSNFMKDYKEVQKYIIDSCCFVTVNGSAIY